jgi:hypothetical protein
VWVTSTALLCQEIAPQASLNKIMHGRYHSSLRAKSWLAILSCETPRPRVLQFRFLLYSIVFIHFWPPKSPHRTPTTSASHYCRRDMSAVICRRYIVSNCIQTNFLWSRSRHQRNHPIIEQRWQGLQFWGKVTLQHMWAFLSDLPHIFDDTLSCFLIQSIFCLCASEKHDMAIMILRKASTAYIKCKTVRYFMVPTQDLLKPCLTLL